MDMHGMTDMAPPPTAMTGGHGMMKKKMMMHMTFFWGKDGSILFTGWPGTSTGMYALALVLTFSLAVLVEFLSRCRLVREERSGVAVGLVRTVAHAVRVGLAYLIMLALMSFNGGVFLAAVVGHAVGFLIFGSRVLGRVDSPPSNAKGADPIAAGC
ncbi:hypothetical protein SAY87_028700 [Trapa incisa]|uniref:Copper transport protein n=1 Tax=Trapa incisa TaxID=236973 RepID=A0AAN7KV71_9MYRT|nr:hypothetical protein SAY87_028700 [Trapa incisa]